MCYLIKRNIERLFIEYNHKIIKIEYDIKNELVIKIIKIKKTQGNPDKGCCQKCSRNICYHLFIFQTLCTQALHIKDFYFQEMKNI